MSEMNFSYLVLWVLAASVSLWMPKEAKNHTLRVRDDPPCQFLDDWGPVDCGSFSVVFGNLDTGISDNTCVRFLVSITTDIAQYRKLLSCKNEGDVWTGISPLTLPYEVSIHTGNLCLDGYSCNDYSGWYDNAWIKYSNQWVNTPTDSHCSFMAWDPDLEEGGVDTVERYKEKRKSLRCIISATPLQ
ncbi:hypothetical protein QBC44DRAFT_22899 [Cladorrhinum sp. PSN332]|nr:hypothetical protein QBC44DRAFT_22899 [Cladorrhinum sp. PSN332]